VAGTCPLVPVVKKSSNYPMSGASFPSRRDQETGLFRQVDYWSLGPAADPKILPQPKPRTPGMCFIMPSIRRGDIGCSEWPDIGRFEHFLKLLDFVDDAFHVHLTTV